MDKLCKKCEIPMQILRSQGDAYWMCKKCNRVDCCPETKNQNPL